MGVSPTAPRPRGEFATPRHLISLAHQYLARLSSARGGEPARWWDMACGPCGALLAWGPPQLQGRVFLSTLHPEDVASARRVWRGTEAAVFAHDFLNDGDAHLPAELRAALTPRSRWVFLLNPPFATGPTLRGPHDAALPRTAESERMRQAGLGKGALELSLQFLARVQRMTETYDLDAAIGVFAPPAFLVSADLAAFRRLWTETFAFATGFCVRSTEFGVATAWPITFTVWQCRKGSAQNRKGSAQKPSAFLKLASLAVQEAAVDLDVYEGEQCIGTKTFAPSLKPLNRWFVRPPNTVEAVPVTSALGMLRNAGGREHRKVTLDRLPEGGLGFCALAGNDVRRGKDGCLLSSASAGGIGWGITPENWQESLVTLGARTLVRRTWLNDRDQFSQPDTHHSGYAQFTRDLIVWLLFSAHNHTASLCVEAEDGRFSEIVNHFFWMTPDELRGSPNLPSSFAPQLDQAPLPFFASWFTSQNLSPDAQAVREAANTLVRSTMALRTAASSRYQLLRWDAGWYQVRRGLFGRDADFRAPHGAAALYLAVKRLHRTLGQRLRPQLHSLGFLPQQMSSDPTCDKVGEDACDKVGEDACGDGADGFEHSAFTTAPASPNSAPTLPLDALLTDDTTAARAVLLLAHFPKARPALAAAFPSGLVTLPPWLRSGLETPEDVFAPMRPAALFAHLRLWVGLTLWEANDIARGSDQPQPHATRARLLALYHVRLRAAAVQDARLSAVPEPLLAQVEHLTPPQFREFCESADVWLRAAAYERALGVAGGRPWHELSADDCGRVAEHAWAQVYAGGRRTFYVTVLDDPEEPVPLRRDLPVACLEELMRREVGRLASSARTGHRNWWVEKIGRGDAHYVLQHQGHHGGAALQKAIRSENYSLRKLFARKAIRSESSSRHNAPT